MKVGSLFSGYGGLDLGVQSVLGGDVAWHCDFDAGPSKVLAHHWPDVRNLHDVTTVDIIRPSLVVWENVRGAYSAAADSNVEPCPVCLGEGEQVHLRALGRVLGDLAELGYDAWWTGVRAADAGAPHSRFRVFVFAWPAADTASPRRTEGEDRRASRSHASSRAWGGEPQRNDGERAALQDPDIAAGDQRRIAAPGQAEGGRARSDARGRGRAPAPNTDGVRLREPRAVGRRSELATAPSRDDAPANSEGHGRNEGRTEPAGVLWGPDPAIGGAGVQWGSYAPAIHRWEHAIGRPAPAPTEPGKTGQPRLSPTFVEWLMGLPHGHVTAVPGLTRNEQLKLLGNGVVPQQAALATRQWLTWRARQSAA